MSYVVDAVPDGALAVISACTRLSLCSAEPAAGSGVAGVNAVRLVSYTVDAGDFTIQNASGDEAAAGGREVVIAAQSGGNATASGTATHAVLDDGTDIRLSRALASNVNTTSGQPAGIGSFKYVIPDPS